mmetsp:Transcript_85553/g.231822  ORF Transcript_85553/g.231822 Transcript_85553/m.231822 type:complete len:255 (+) Transcript_85553:1349-2113(+)
MHRDQRAAKSRSQPLLRDAEISPGAWTRTASSSCQTSATRQPAAASSSAACAARALCNASPPAPEVPAAASRRFLTNAGVPLALPSEQVVDMLPTLPAADALWRASRGRSSSGARSSRSTGARHVAIVSSAQLTTLERDAASSSMWCWQNASVRWSSGSRPAPSMQANRCSSSDSALELGRGRGSPWRPCAPEASLASGARGPEAGGEEASPGAEPGGRGSRKRKSRSALCTARPTVQKWCSSKTTGTNSWSPS